MATEVDALSSEEEAELVAVLLDNIIIGRPLTHPAYDRNGVLLLAKGATVTPEFKRALANRQIGEISMHADDVALMTVTMTSFDDSDTSIFNSELAKRIDEVVDSSNMFVSNRGPAVRASLVRHGRKLYNAARREEASEQWTDSTASLNSMMSEAMRGRQVSSQLVSQMASSYLAELTDDADMVLSLAAEASKDPTISEHCLRMAVLGMALAVEMGFDAENVRRTCLAGMVHDWGMARVREDLRKAPRLLSQAEFFEIRKHPIYTLELLERTFGIPSIVRVIAYQVHERPDGSGYPRQRLKSRIHPLARILAVADTYSALTSPQPYRPPLMPYAAMECILKLAAKKQLDQDAVRAMLHMMTLFPIGSLVVISDGSLARVIRRNGDDYVRPIIQILQSPSGERIPAGRDDAAVDLAQDTRSIIQAIPTPRRQETSFNDDILYQRRIRDMH